MTNEKTNPMPYRAADAAANLQVISANIIVANFMGL